MAKETVGLAQPTDTTNFVNFIQLLFTKLILLMEILMLLKQELGYVISKFYARPRSNISILPINYICVECNTAISHKFSRFSGQLFQQVPLKWIFSSYLLLKQSFLLSSARPDYIVGPSETKGTISSEHNKPTEVLKDESPHLSANSPEQILKAFMVTKENLAEILK